jgi:predicted ATPase
MLRPNEEDSEDDVRLTQSFLEQVNENRSFRELATFLEGVTYLHLVPQLLRYSDEFQGRVLEADPFGQSLLERIAKTPKKTQKARLRRIAQALKSALPQLRELQFEKDEVTGRPHLAALYDHWRPNAARQREDQFSDGTLRLIGLLWSLTEGDSLLLLEEPELSLNAAIVGRMAPLIYRMQKSRKRQVVVSTHSVGLLRDPGVRPNEVLLLEPCKEGTSVTPLSEMQDIRRLMDAGMTAGEVALPRTAPKQLQLFSF